MTKLITYPDHQEFLEYHGNTFVAVTRQKAGATVWRDWLFFDSVEEAYDYFNDVG